MKLCIEHTTRYTYDQPVQLNVHIINLIPQFRNYFKLDAQEIQITPIPKGLQTRLDLECNLHHQAWFEGFTESLAVYISYELTIHELNPYGFILNPTFSFNQQGMAYAENDLPLLLPFLQVDPQISNFNFFALGILQESDQIVSFLVKLVSEVHTQWKYEVRQEEGVWSPEKTFQAKHGSCRDLAWMLIQMLRSAGFAARFVSGYAFNSELEEGHELHAWTEVYLPGAGWIGLDPSLGLLTDHHYIPLACSADFERAAPIVGTYGGKAASFLETYVSMKAN
ncbi:MAG: transglutaminase family protein [Mongoliitalea sp.]